MRPVRRLSAFVLSASLLAASPALSQDSVESDGALSTSLNEAKALETVANVIEEGIRPAYQAFDDAVRQTGLKIETLCSNPSEPALEEAREGFGDLVSAFARTEFVRFGPIREDNRLERILFYPDPRGIVRRQVEQLVANEDDSALRVESLKAKSVALQGLPALEFLLFGEGAAELSDTDAGYRCAYGKAIMGNLQAIASDVTQAWSEETGIFDRLTHPNADNPAYRSASDSIGEIVSMFNEGFELMRDQRLSPALGQTGEAANPGLFLFNRSDNALNALQADFAGAKALFDAAGFAEVLPGPQDYLVGSITLELDQIAQTLSKIDSPLGDGAGDPEWRGKLDYVRIAAGSLHQQFQNQLAPALGLSSGFSSLDGD